ncbi:alpha/beta hydrolase [Nocardia sp. NPDC049149]|uniref:alpha/beta hydrolase n=1 Tax=Nocardia sp. NPDC049149 TaxID=3364315 RepID=UPI00371672EC
MNTIGRIRGCEPDTMSALAVDLTSGNDTFSTRVDQMSRDVDRSMGGWQGQSADAAQSCALGHQLSANHLGSTVLSIAGHCTTFGKSLAQTRATLLALVDQEIPAAGMSTKDDGTVTPPTVPASGVDAPDPAVRMILQQRLDNQAAGFQQRVQALMTIFGDTETQAAQAISSDLRLLEQYRTRPGEDPAAALVAAIRDGRTQLPTDPQMLRDFWMKLSPAEKDAFFQKDHFIGNRDGIPQADRDHYNRLNLNDLRDKAQRRLDAIVAAHEKAKRDRDPNCNDSSWLERIAAAQKEVNGYNNVFDQSQAKDGVPRLLSLVDDKGHAAVAFRNPDSADNVCTYVPGTGATTTDAKLLGDDVNRSDVMRRAAELSDPSKKTSVVTWIGYDAPQSIPSAIWDSYAAGAAKPLDDFQSGLRVTHEGARSANTVLGHSYGTTVIGHAASNNHTLDADKVVLVASPGIDVDRPEKLHLTGVASGDVRSRLYSTAAVWDPVAGPMLSVAPHGPEPHLTPGWGTVFSNGGGWVGGAHSSYWDEGNPALTNMGNIISGQGKVS